MAVYLSQWSSFVHESESTCSSTFSKILHVVWEKANLCSEKAWAVGALQLIGCLHYWALTISIYK